MTEHISLTEQEVAEIEARQAHVSRLPWLALRDGSLSRVFNDDGDVAYFGDDDLSENNAVFIAHAPTDIPRLIADWKAMRQLLVELTAGEEAGIVNHECAYCHAITTSRRGTYYHATDCPIVRGRALVQQP